MMKVTISSIEFEYSEGFELANVDINYRGRTEDYQHNLSGVLKIDANTFYENSRPHVLEVLVRDYIADLLTTKEPVEGEPVE